MTQTKTLNMSNVSKDYFQYVSSPTSRDPNARRKSSRKYQLTFRIPYKTEFGESLQVVGSIDELGAWKSYKVPMKWMEGHVWVAENLLIQSSSFFTYKYVVMKDDKAVKWEQGPNRVADLAILPDRSRVQNQYGGSTYNMNKSRSIDSHPRLAEHESSHSGMHS
jgi:hypothetical protein